MQSSVRLITRLDNAEEEEEEASAFSLVLDIELSRLSNQDLHNIIDCFNNLV